MDAVKKFTVKVQTHLASVPRVFEAEVTYEKGSFFCIKLGPGRYKKIPIASIFDIDEDYNTPTE